MTLGADLSRGRRDARREFVLGGLLRRQPLLRHRQRRLGLLGLLRRCRHARVLGRTVLAHLIQLQETTATRQSEGTVSGQTRSHLFLQFSAALGSLVGLATRLSKIFSLSRQQPKQVHSEPQIRHERG